MRDNLKATGTLAAFLAVAVVIFCASRSLACDALTGADNQTCAEWAPISGDVAEDACQTAALDVERVNHDLADLDRPRQPGNPIWTREFLHKLRNEALARQVRACATHSVDMR